MFQKFKSYKVTMHQVTTKTINQLKQVINKHKLHAQKTSLYIMNNSHEEKLFTNPNNDAKKTKYTRI